MLRTWASASSTLTWQDSRAYQCQRWDMAPTTAASCHQSPAKATIKRSQATTTWVMPKGTRSVKLQIPTMKLKEITETLQNQRMPSRPLTCNGRNQAWASATRKTRRRRKRRIRKRARKSGRSDIVARRGHNSHCYHTISYTRLGHMAMATQMRIRTSRIATIQLQQTVQLTFYICSSRRVATQGCIHQHFSQVIAIQEIFH